MLKMFQQQLLTRIISVLYVLVYLVPRQFGLLAANCDVRMRRQFKSRFWLLYSIICGCTFTISYPFAITAILSKIKTLHEGNVFIFIEISNYVALYILTVAIYVRIMFSSTKHMNYNNLAFSLLDDCKALVIDQREYEYIIPFAARVLYLYFGYATLNAITLYQNSDNLKLVPIFYKCLFFLPDIVMANTMIRQHTSIALQAICCKRINQAFSECMDVAKKIRNLSTPYARLRMGSHATQRFDKITECHAKLYKVTRETESLSAILMIFAILKAFAHLSSMLFLLIDHIRSNATQNKDFVIIGTVKCIFYMFDLIFIFSPANRLKRELHKVGDAIYNGSFTKLPNDLQRSIDQFSIYLLHQKKSFNVGGMFELDNNFFYSVLSAMVSYVIFFVQFKSLED